ncbi:MAG: family transcriptional regulator, regulator of embCAB operon [Actinomycetota bacterium]|nr:family transcriptional regulator, regulator of embCAB operon [Actinomycetota bacterium]
MNRETPKTLRSDRSEADRNPSQLRIDILGALVVLRGDTPLDVGPAMVRNLLAVLALNVDKPVPRDRIVQALWGDAPPSTSRNLVHGYVSRLRSQLKDPSSTDEDETLVIRDGSGYRLRVDPESVDATRFDLLSRKARRAVREGREPEALGHYEKAFECWRGEVLEDLEPQIRQMSAVTALTQRWIDSVIEYAVLCRARGLHASALGYLRRATEVSPLHESLHARLMTALSDVGDRAAALEVHAAIRERLSTELGVDPGNDLQTVYLRILRETHDEPADSETAGRTTHRPSALPGSSPAPKDSGSLPPARSTSRRPRWHYALGVVVCLTMILSGTWAVFLRDNETARTIGTSFHEDFTKPLDQKIWKSYDQDFPNGSRWTPSAVTVRDNELQITGKGRNSTGAGNTAGGVMIRRKSAVPSRYGEWQVRAKFDAGSGYAPVIGLITETKKLGSEYITLALVEQPDRSGGYALFRSTGDEQYRSDPQEADLTGWNTYSLEWRPDFLKISLNDLVILDTRKMSNDPKIPSTPMFFYMQLETGPSDSVPAANEETPDQVVMHVEWVKYHA